MAQLVQQDAAVRAQRRRPGRQGRTPIGSSRPPRRTPHPVGRGDQRRNQDPRRGEVQRHAEEPTHGKQPATARRRSRGGVLLTSAMLRLLTEVFSQKLSQLGLTVLAMSVVSPCEPEAPVIGSLSPSRAADFKVCPLLYRFRTIDRLPEPPSRVATRGTRRTFRARAAVRPAR